MENYFGIYKKYWGKKIPEGTHEEATNLGARPCGLWPPWQAFGAHLLLYYVFWPGKNQKEAFRMKRRRLEAKIGQNQSRAPAELFCRGTSLQEGEIEAIAITNDPLIERGSISINIFTGTISSQTLFHLLYSISVSKPHIGTCGLLVVLITPCSWC